MNKAGSSPMTNVEPSQRPSTAPWDDLSPSTRIDAPHEMRASEPESDCGASFPAAASATEHEGLHLQAGQLASLLRGQKKELDEREAELNSRIALWESDVRASRLFYEQRQAEISAAEELLARKSSELSADAKSLDERKKDLRVRETAIVAKEGALSRRKHEINRLEREARERLDRLAVAEAAQIENARKAEERSADAERRWATCERLIAEQNQAKKEIELRSQAVEKRAEHVDKCQASLRQLREELGRMHRETLEIRLATEELWVQLAGAAPPAALTRSLGRIRTKLAEQYAQANAELAERKRELETIRARLEEQFRKLLEQRRRFDGWAAGRRQECESQASRLIAREQQLQLESDRIRRQSQSWQAERIKYQRMLHGRQKCNRMPSGQ